MNWTLLLPKALDALKNPLAKGLYTSVFEARISPKILEVQVLPKGTFLLPHPITGVLFMWNHLFAWRLRNRLRKAIPYRWLIDLFCFPLIPLVKIALINQVNHCVLTSKKWEVNFRYASFRLHVLYIVKDRFLSIYPRNDLSLCLDFI